MVRGEAMDKTVHMLEDMLFKSQAKEIGEIYNEVLNAYKEDLEVSNIINTIKGICDYILSIYKEIPNPEKKLDENLYSTLYSTLKDLSNTLYDLSIAEGEQLYYVISSAYQKLNGANNLLEKLT